MELFNIIIYLCFIKYYTKMYLLLITLMQLVYIIRLSLLN